MTSNGDIQPLFHMNSLLLIIIHSVRSYANIMVTIGNSTGYTDSHDFPQKNGTLPVTPSLMGIFFGNDATWVSRDYKLG